MWGLLPDNDDTLTNWGKRFGVSPRNPFALLSEVGEDLQGAIQMVSPAHADALRRREGITPLSREVLAESFAALVRDPGATQFTKGGGQWLESIAATGCAGVGLDWTMDIGEARRRLGDGVTLQGNLDPAIMLTSPEVVAAEARRVLDSMGAGGRHIFNLGHGITPDVPIENVAALSRLIQAWRRPDQSA